MSINFLFHQSEYKRKTLTLLFSILLSYFSSLFIGALIKKDDVAQEICFKKSIQAANKLLQQHDSTNHRFQLIPIIETIDGDDSFEATRKGFIICYIYIYI